MGKQSKNKSDDVLFEALGKAKKKKKRRIILTIIIIILIVGIGLVAATRILRRKVRNQFASNKAEVVSTQANIGSISTTVSGSGTLTDVDIETLTVPTGVEIEEVLVSVNDIVAEGDVIAMIDLATVASAMSSVQAELDELDEEIAKASDETVEDTMKAGVAGRVKAIYVEEGQDVAKCMYEKGALMLISVDGYMALDLENDTLVVGDEVTVVCADGSEIEGSVESASNGKVVILVTDNGTNKDEEVTVKDADGNELGSGILYIHNALSVTGIAGTVEDINVSENTKVSADTTILYLEDTQYSANYETLLKERKAKAEELLELMQLQQEGALLASFSGTVSSVEYKETEEQTTTTTTTEEAETTVVTLAPGVSMNFTISVDETDILSLAEGQEVTVSIESIGEDTYAGTVTDITKTASGSSGVTQYTAEITLDKTKEMLAGMTAKASVKIEGVDNAILIPIEALHQTRSTSFVYTQYDEETQEYGGMVEVQTGLSNSKYVEITEGLKEGDTVYYTESESFDFSSFGGGMPFGGGGEGGMPDFGGGMPEGGGMPNFEGGMPDFEGGRPSGGGMPSGFGGERPSRGGN